MVLSEHYRYLIDTRRLLCIGSTVEVLLFLSWCFFLVEVEDICDERLCLHRVERGSKFMCGNLYLMRPHSISRKIASKRRKGSFFLEIDTPFVADAKRIVVK